MGYRGALSAGPSGAGCRLHRPRALAATPPGADLRRFAGVGFQRQTPTHATTRASQSDRDRAVRNSLSHRRERAAPACPGLLGRGSSIGRGLEYRAPDRPASGRGRHSEHDPTLSDDFKLLIEQVKAHSPIEDVVRERVPTLRRAGALWVACCPFHEEKTPSFKVDPRRGTWNCYGACGTGGDQLSFVQRAYNVEFREALEILAGRAGIALPERGARDGATK